MTPKKYVGKYKKLSLNYSANVYRCNDRDWYWISIYNSFDTVSGYFISGVKLLSEFEVDDEN